MSTRCQIKVIQEGLSWEESVMLYHHTDGYPEYMIPNVFAKAYQYSRKPFYKDDKHTFCGWEKGRAGKVAGLLCWADPCVTEPEAGFDLHGDIEYLYILYCINQNSGSLEEKARWELEVYRPKDNFWDNPTMDNMQKFISRKNLEALIQKFPKRKS